MPVIPWPEESAPTKLLLFSDSSAVHSSCPAARLTYWFVVRAPAMQTEEDMRRWASSPVPVSWAAGWGSYRSSLQETGNLLSLKGDSDLAAPLLACDRLTLRKVKAHNPEGANAMATPLLRLTTEESEAADLAAKQASSQESSDVFQAAEEVFNHYHGAFCQISGRYQCDGGQT